MPPHSKLQEFYSVYTWASSCFLIWVLGTAPIIWSTTSPFLKIRRAGILRIPYLTETSGLWSTFTFPIFAFPSYSPASSSTMGPIIRHGPHHSAQKSTRTGWSELSTSAEKLLSFNSIGLLIMYCLSGLVFIYVISSITG